MDCSKEIDGHKLEGFWRAHQVPMADVKEESGTTSSTRKLDARVQTGRALRSNGKLIPELKELAPTGARRMGANPHANGGHLKKALRLPDFRHYALQIR